MPMYNTTDVFAQNATAIGGRLTGHPAVGNAGWSELQHVFLETWRGAWAHASAVGRHRKQAGTWSQVLFDSAAHYRGGQFDIHFGELS